MELELDSKVLLSALSTVELKGKYCGDNCLRNDSLGDSVKIFAVADSWRQGYYFCNGNPFSFISYYLPAIVEEDDDCVLNLVTLIKHLKNMKGNVKLHVEDLCTISSDTKETTLPISMIHPYEQALNRYLRLTLERCVYSDTLQPLEFRDFTLNSGVDISMSELRDAITTCETVDSGVYQLVIDSTDGLMKFWSSNMTGEQTSTAYECNTIGDALIRVTSPIHKAFTKNDRVNIYFNDDFGETEGQPLVAFSTNVCLIRAPYVQLEVE